MASYQELQALVSDDGLRSRVAMACVVAADIIRAEVDTTPNHTVRVKWAGEVLRDPKRMGDQMWLAVLAQNRTFTVAQIQAAADTAIQTAVNAAVDLCALSLP